MSAILKFLMSSVEHTHAAIPLMALSVHPEIPTEAFEAVPSWARRLGLAMVIPIITAMVTAGATALVTQKIIEVEIVRMKQDDIMQASRIDKVEDRTSVLEKDVAKVQGQIEGSKQQRR